jgi:branched-chain amino acid transport system permease protein
VLVALIGAVFGVVSFGIRGLTTPLASLVITLGLAFLAASLELLAFGDRPHTYPAISDRAWDIAGVVVQPQYVLIAGVALVAALALTFILRRTIVGHAVVACSDSQRAAELVGLNIRSVAVVTFAVSAALSALGGLLLTPVVPVNYDSDVAIAVNGFAAAAFGGLVSIRLAYLGGLVLGVAEQLVVGYGDIVTAQARQYELAAALVIMLVLIGWRSRHEAIE